MSAEPIDVVIHDREDYRGELSLKVGSREVAKVTLRGSEKDVTIGKFVWPEGAASASVSGELRFTHYDRGPQVTRGSQEWKVIDLAPLTKPLRDASLPIAERLKRLIAAQETFEAKHVALVDGTSRLFEPPDKRATRAEVQAAEKRLGFSLPVEHVQLLEDFGTFTVEDSLMMPVELLKNAFDQMEQDWETPRERLDRLPTKTKQLLRSSVLLYTESGDGYGGWLYQPPVEPNGKPSYFWIHQETITRQRRLTNRDGSAKNYSQALLWLLTQQVISRYGEGSDKCVFVDRSSPATLKYRLVPGHNPAFEATLYLEWEEFE